MQPVDRDDLDAALHALPAPRAPRTLLPRVLAATAHLQPRPWYVRTWLTWPAAWQAASIVALVALVGTGAVLWPYVASFFSEAVALTGPAAARFGVLMDQAAVVPTLVRVLWRALLQPVALFAFAMSILTALTCAAGWTAINHLAIPSEGPAHP